MFKWAIAILMFLAVPAQAQWYYTENAPTALRSAGMCPLDGEMQGRPSLCFYVMCDNQGPLRFELVAVNDRALETAPSMRVMVMTDDALAGTLMFERHGSTLHLRAPLEDFHLTTLDRLQKGNRGELRIWMGPDQPQPRIPLSLKGSGTAIGEVRAACPLPDFEARAEARRRSDDPAGLVLAEVTEACSGMGGTVTQQEGFVTQLDVDADGRMDQLVNYGAARCSAGGSLHCGSAGCQQALYLAMPEGDFRRVLTGNIYALTPLAPGVVQLSLHGSFCGGQGADTCRKTLRLIDGDMVEQP